DAQQSGRETNIVIDRASAARLGLSVSQIDNTLYDAFGQRQVSTIYGTVNQYHVVMEVAPRYWQSPQTLQDIFISTSGASPSGTASTNAPAGAVSAVPSVSRTAATTVSLNNSARDASINAIAATGRSSASSGSPVSTNVEKMIPLAA